MEYGYVNEGKVEKVFNKCPDSFGNMSGLNGEACKDSDRSNVNLYPIHPKEQILKNWQRFGDISYEFKTNYIESSYGIKNLTLSEYKNRRIREMEIYLDSMYPALYKQINAERGDIYPEEKNIEILVKVTELRNYFYEKSNEINACTTLLQVSKINYEVEE